MAMAEADSSRGGGILASLQSAFGRFRRREVTSEKGQVSGEDIGKMIREIDALGIEMLGNARWQKAQELPEKDSVQKR